MTNVACNHVFVLLHSCSYMSIQLSKRNVFILFSQQLHLWWKYFQISVFLNYIITVIVSRYWQYSKEFDHKWQKIQRQNMSKHNLCFSILGVLHCFLYSKKTKKRPTLCKTSRRIVVNTNLLSKYTSSLKIQTCFRLVWNSLISMLLWIQALWIYMNVTWT